MNGGTTLVRGQGLVLGKFMPPHLGHQLLFDFAQTFCEGLHIQVCTLPDDPIDGELRFQWVKEMAPRANVVHQSTVVPQSPEEHPEFWSLWKAAIRQQFPGVEFDYFLASELYGWRVAEELGAEYVPVDRLRAQMDICATVIRDKPLENWDYLPPGPRAYYSKRVCLVGPESVGKSTLARRLAQKFETVCVDEYARALLDEYILQGIRKDGEVWPEDFAVIARGQAASEDALARQANRLLICDTDLLTTCFFANFFLGTCPDWLELEASSRRYDLYLLLDSDCPWVDDGQRCMSQAQRDEAVDWWKRELDRLGRSYVLIGGTYAEREERATHAVTTLLSL